MSVIEKVALAIIKGIVEQDGDKFEPEDWDGKVAWIDQGETDIVEVARAALTALLEGLEPVAWRYHHPNCGDTFYDVAGSRWTDETRGPDWTETPLYDLTALREALK